MSIVVAMLVGCGGSGKVTTNGDGGVVVETTCTANATSCLNDHVSLTCTSDGKALIGVPCSDGEICTNGACAKDPNAPCSPSQNSCQDGTTALQCASTGKGFNVVACPANTACIEGGVCYGADAVGATYCTNGATATETTTDGYTYTTTSCATGTACVDQYDQNNVDHATCLPSECTPPAFGCGPTQVCGNPKDATVSNQSTLSTCTETPLGWKWVTSTCGAGQYCQGGANSCGDNYYAECVDTTNGCTPGEKSCYIDSIITCNANGQWNFDTATSCITATMVDGTCINTGNGPVCGDSACADHNGGVCDKAGKYHNCNPDFTVNPTANDCAKGICTPVGEEDTDSAGYIEGACVVQCQDGDERCVLDGFGSGYQVCTNGLWGTAQNCANGGFCWNTTSNENRPSTFCGVCLPGSTQCDGDQIQTCNTDGSAWGADTACAMGVCQQEYVGHWIGVCRVQCIPNQVYCAGNNATDQTSGMYGKTGTQTCDATGVLQAEVDCPATQLCRVGPSSNGANNYYPDGQVLGCVVCVGTKNAFGLPDTRCTNATGDATSSVFTDGYTETCGANNTWDATTITQCVAPNNYCWSPSTYINLDATSTASPPYPANCNVGD